jgi:hypothetical protein
LESDLTLTNIQFVGNKGVGYGGGLFVENGQVKITGRTIVRGNEVSADGDGYGGGMAFKSAGVRFEGDLTFEDNIASREGSKGFGGAIASIGSSFTLSGAQFIGNRGNVDGDNGYGGAIAVICENGEIAKPSLVLEGVEFRENIALDHIEGNGKGHGGAIYAQFCDVIAYHGTVLEDNIASTGKGEAKGGAIYLATGDVSKGGGTPKVGLLDESVIRHNYGTKHPEASSTPYVGGGIYAEGLSGLVLQGQYDAATGELVSETVSESVSVPRIYDNYPSANPEKCASPTTQNVYPHEQTRTAYLHVGNTPSSPSGYRFEPAYIDAKAGTLTQFICILPSDIPEGMLPEVSVLPLEPTSGEAPKVLSHKEILSGGKLRYEYRLETDVEIYLHGVSEVHLDDLGGSVSYQEDLLPGPLHVGFPEAFVLPYSDTLYFTLRITDESFWGVDSKIKVQEGGETRKELTPYHREAGVHYYKYEPLAIKNVVLAPSLEYLILQLPTAAELAEGGLELPEAGELGAFTQPTAGEDYKLSEGQTFTFYVKETYGGGDLDNDATLPALTFSGLGGEERVTAVQLFASLYRFTIKVPMEATGLQSGSKLPFRFIRAKRSELNVQVGYGSLTGDFSKGINFASGVGVPKDGILSTPGWYYYYGNFIVGHELGLRVQTAHLTPPNVDLNLVPRVTLDNKVLDYAKIDDPHNLFGGVDPNMMFGLYTYYFHYDDNAKIKDCSSSSCPEVHPMSSTLCVGRVHYYNVYFQKLPKEIFPLSLLSYGFKEAINTGDDTKGDLVKEGLNLLRSESSWKLPFCLKWDKATAHKLRPVVTRMSLVEENGSTINKKIVISPTGIFEDSLKYEIGVKDEDGGRDAVIGVSLDVVEIEYPQLPYGVKYVDGRPAGIHYFGAITGSGDEWIDTFQVRLPDYMKIKPKFTITRKDLPGADDVIVEPVGEKTNAANGVYGYRVWLKGTNVAAVLSATFNADYTITFPYRKEMPEGIQYVDPAEQGGPHYYGTDNAGVSIMLTTNSKQVGYAKAILTPSDKSKSSITIELEPSGGSQKLLTISKAQVQTGTISFVPTSYRVILLPLTTAGVKVSEESGIQVGENRYSGTEEIDDKLVLTLAPNYIGFTPEVRKYRTAENDGAPTIVPVAEKEGNNYQYDIGGEEDFWLEVILSEPEKTVELSVFGMPSNICYSGDRLAGEYHIRNGKDFEFIVNIEMVAGNWAIPLPRAYDIEGAWDEYANQPEMEKSLNVETKGSTYYYSYRYKIPHVSENIRIIVPSAATGTLVLPTLPTGLQYRSSNSLLSKGKYTYRWTDPIDEKLVIEKTQPAGSLEVPYFEWKMKPPELDIDKYFTLTSEPSADEASFAISGSFWGKEGQVTSHTWRTMATELELAADESYYQVKLPSLPVDGELAYLDGRQAGKKYPYPQAGELVVKVEVQPLYEEASVRLLDAGGRAIEGVRTGDTYYYTFRGKSYLTLEKFEVSYQKVTLPALAPGFQYVDVPCPQEEAGAKDYYFTKESAEKGVRILSTDTTGVWFGLQANLIEGAELPTVTVDGEEISPIEPRGGVGYYHIPLSREAGEVVVQVDRGEYYCVKLPELENSEEVAYYAGEEAHITEAGEYIVQGGNTLTFYLLLKKPYQLAALTVEVDGEPLDHIETPEGTGDGDIYKYTIDGIDEDKTVTVEVSYNTLTLTPTSLLPGMSYKRGTPLAYYSARDWNVSFEIEVEPAYKAVEPIVSLAEAGSIVLTKAKLSELVYRYTVTGSGNGRVEIGWVHVSVTLPAEGETFRYRNINPDTYPKYHTLGAEICFEVEPFGIYSEGVPYITMKEDGPPKDGVKQGWTNRYRMCFNASEACAPNIDVRCSELKLPEHLPEGLVYEPFAGESECKTTRYHHPENEWTDSFKLKTQPGYEGVPPVVRTTLGTPMNAYKVENNTYIYKFTHKGDLHLYIDHPSYKVTLLTETPSFSYVSPPSATRYAPGTMFSFVVRVADDFSGSEPVAIVNDSPLRGVRITENDYRFEFSVVNDMVVKSIDLKSGTLYLPKASELPAGLSYTVVDANKLRRYHSDKSVWVDSFRIEMAPLYSHITPEFYAECEELGTGEVVPDRQDENGYRVYKVYGMGNVVIKPSYTPCMIDFPTEEPNTFIYVGAASAGTWPYDKEWEVKFSVQPSGEYTESEPVAVLYGTKERRLQGERQGEVYTFSFNIEDDYTTVKIEPSYVTFTLPEELPIGLSYAEADAANPVRRHKPNDTWTEQFTLEAAPAYRQMLPVVKNKGVTIVAPTPTDGRYMYTVSGEGDSDLEISLPCATVRLPVVLPDELEYLDADAGNLLRVHPPSVWTETFRLHIKEHTHIVPLVRTSKGDILTGVLERNDVYRYTFTGQGDLSLSIDFLYHTVILPSEDANLFTYVGDRRAGNHVVQAGETLTISVQREYANLDLMAVLNSQEVIRGKKRQGTNIYDITFTIQKDYRVQILPYYYTLILPQTLPNGLAYDPRHSQGGPSYSSTTELFCDTFAIEVQDEMLWEVIPQAFLTVDGVVTDSLLKPYKSEGRVHFYSLRFVGNASVRIELNYQMYAFMLPKTLPTGLHYASGSKEAGTYAHYTAAVYRDTFILETEENFAQFRPIVTVKEKEVTPYHRTGRRYYYAIEADNSVLMDIRMTYFQLSLPVPAELPVGIAYVEEPESYHQFCIKGEIITITLKVLSPYEDCMPLVRVGTQTLTLVKLPLNNYRYTIKTADIEGASGEVIIEMDGVQVTLPPLPPHLSYVSSQGLSEGMYYVQQGMENSFVIRKQTGYEAGLVTVKLNGQTLEGIPLDDKKQQVEYFFTAGKERNLNFQVSFEYYAVEFPNELPDGLSIDPVWSTLKSSKVYPPIPTEETLVISAPAYGVIPTVKLKGAADTEKLEPFYIEKTASQHLFHYTIPIASSFAVHISIVSCTLVLPELPPGLAYVDGYPGAGEHVYPEGTSFTFRVRVLPPYEGAELTAMYIKNNTPVVLYCAKPGTTFVFSGTITMEYMSIEIAMHYKRFTLPSLPAGLSYRSDSKSAGDYYHAPNDPFTENFVLLLDEDKIHLVPIVTSTAGELTLTYEPPCVYKYKLVSLVDAQINVSLPQYTVTLPELPSEQLFYTGDRTAGEHVIGYGKELSFTLKMSDAYAAAIPYTQIFGETYSGTQAGDAGLYAFSIPVYGNDVSEIKLKYLSLTLPEAPEKVAYLPKLKQQGVYRYAPNETFRDSFALQLVETYRNAKLQVLCNGQPLNPYRSEGKASYYCVESDVDTQVEITLLYETFLLTLPELPEGLLYTGAFTKVGVHEVYGTTSFTDTLTLQTEPDDYSLLTPKVLQGTHILPIFSETELPEGGKLFRYVVTGTGNVTLSVELPCYTFILPSLSGILGAPGYTEGLRAGAYRVSLGTPFDFSIQVTDPRYANVAPFVQRVAEGVETVTLVAMSASGTTYNYRCVNNTQATVQVKVSMPHDTLSLPAQNILPEGVSYASGSIAAGTHLYTRGKIASFSLSVAQGAYVIPLVTLNGNPMPYGQTSSRVYRFEFPIEGYTEPQIGSQPFIVLTLPPDLPTGVMYAADSKAGGKHYHPPGTSFRDTFSLKVQDKFSEIVPLVFVDGEVELQPYIREGNIYRYAVTGNQDMAISVTFEYYTVTVLAPPSGVFFAESSPIKQGFYYHPKGRNTTDEIILQLREDLNPDKLVLTLNGHQACPVLELTGNEFVYLVSSSTDRVYNIHYDYRCIVLPELPSGLTYASTELSPEIIKAGRYYFSNQQSEPFAFRVVIADILLQQGRLPIVGIGIETILPVIVTNSLYEYTINSSTEADLYVKISLLGDPPPNEPPTSIKKPLPEVDLLPSAQYLDGEFTFNNLGGYRLLLTAADGRLLKVFLIGSEVEQYRLSLSPGVYILVGQKGGTLTFKWKFVIR